MNKQNAINAIKFLDRVEIKGHQEREALTAVCQDLLAIVNAEEPQENSEPDGKADTD